MPYDSMTKNGRLYVRSRDSGKLTPSGGYPNTSGGRARRAKYLSALYFNVLKKETRG